MSCPMPPHQVQCGKPCNLATFKAVWLELHFSFIHQATPAALSPTDHLQLLFSAALNRLDINCPSGLLADAFKQAAQAPQEQHAQPGEGVRPPHAPADQPAGPSGTADPIRHHPHHHQQPEHAPEGRGGELHGQGEQHGHCGAHELGGQHHDGPLMPAQQHAVDDDLTMHDLFQLLDAEPLPLADPAGAPATAAAATTATDGPHAGPGNATTTPAAAAPATGPATQRQHDAETGLAQGPCGPSRRAEPLPPLVVRIGVIYALYCLYNTQPSRPRLHVYLPLVLLEELIAMVPELEAAGYRDALKILKVMWRENAFLIGELRRPPSFLHDTLGPDGKRGRNAINALNEDLMENRSMRDALFHLRSDLNTLADFGQLGQAVDAYHLSRKRIFGLAAADPARGLEPTTSGRLPPMLFPASYATELQRLLEQQVGTVATALQPEVCAHHSRGKRRPTKAAAAAAAAAQAAEEAAAAAAAPPADAEDVLEALDTTGDLPQDVYIGGMLGDLLRRGNKSHRNRPSGAGAAPAEGQRQGQGRGRGQAQRQQQQQEQQQPQLQQEPNEQPLLDDDRFYIEGMESDGHDDATLNLSSKVLEVERLKRAKLRQRCEVQNMWLAAHTRLMRDEGTDAADAGPGVGGAAGPGRPGEQVAGVGPSGVGLGAGPVRQQGRAQQQRGASVAVRAAASGAASPVAESREERQQRWQKQGTTSPSGGTVLAAAAAAVAGSSQPQRRQQQRKRPAPAQAAPSSDEDSDSATSESSDEDTATSSDEDGATSNDDATVPVAEAAMERRGGGQLGAARPRPKRAATGSQEPRPKVAGKPPVGAKGGAAKARAKASSARQSSDGGAQDQHAPLAAAAAANGRGSSEAGPSQVSGGIGEAEVDPDLAAELEAEFGEDDEEDEDSLAGPSTTGRAPSQRTGGGGTGDDSGLPPIQAVVWCSQKPGLLTVSGGGKKAAVRCFCEACQDGGGGEGGGGQGMDPLAFYRHCGLKGKAWKIGILVDEELQLPADSSVGVGDGSVRTLLRGRAATKGGAKRKRLGEWFKEAVAAGRLREEPKAARAASSSKASGASAPRASRASASIAGKKAPAAAAAAAADDASAPPVSAGPQPTGAAAADPMQVDDEYADVWAQLEKVRQIQESVGDKLSQKEKPKKK